MRLGLDFSFYIKMRYFLRILFALTTMLLISENSVAQNHGGRSNHWHFGKDLNGYSGFQMNFNGLTPSPVTTSPIFSPGAPISVSDRNGNLLFFADYDTIYDASGQMMQNGFISNYPLWAESRVVLPVPCNQDLYYIFMAHGQLTYTVVDMSLNSGLGAVVPGQTNVPVLGSDSLMPLITATLHDNNKDYWILTRKAPGNRWAAYLFSDTGISANPVFTDIGLPITSVHNALFGAAVGQIKFSHSGDKMAMANNRKAVTNNCRFYYNFSIPCSSNLAFELFDFDRVTGVLSNVIELHHNDSSFFNWNFHPWGESLYLTSVEFSSADDILYGASGTSIIQYDLSSAHAPTIQNTYHVLDNGNIGESNQHLQLGPDGKMYVARNQYIGVIHNPSVFGNTANYSPYWATLPTAQGYKGFPNMVSDALITRTTQTIPHQNCEGDSFHITLSDTNFLDSVLFQFPGEPPAVVQAQNLPHSIMFPQYGTYPYYAVAYSGCEEDTIFDTLRVHPQPNAHLGPDTLLCEGDTFAMNLQDTTFSYLWNTGDTTPGIEIFLPDTYSVTVTSQYCGADTDEVVIDSIIPAIVRLPNDTLLCLGDTLELDAEVALGTYQWSTNDTTPQYIVREEGTYSVTATNLCRSDSDTVTVLYARPPNANLGNDSVLCTGNPVTLDAADTLSTYQWNNSSTDSAITVDSTGVYRVTVTNLCGTSIAGIHLRFADTTNLDLGPDTVLCPQDAYELNAAVPFGENYTWHTGATGNTFQVVQEDTYSVTVDHVCGTLRDTVIVHYDRTPQPDLGPDTRYCFDDLVELDATWSRAQYLWNTGSTDSIIQAVNNGEYWVQVTNLCGRGDDTVKLWFHTPLDFELGGDNTICEGDTIQLRAYGVEADYVWNTGETDSLINVSNKGIYWVRAENACGPHHDTISIRMIHSPAYEFDKPDSICEGDIAEVRIKRHNRAELAWFDGSDQPRRQFTQKGNYPFTLENICGQKTDSVIVNVSNLPEIHLGNDTLLCSGEELKISAPNNAKYLYEWSTGDTTPEITITHPDYYGVTVTNPPDCSVEDFITITECGMQLYIPNAFTPNGDGLNDVFKMESVELDEFSIHIFDRWGRLLFHSTSTDFEWDGTYRGKIVNQGMYTYKIWFRKGDYRSEEKIGTVTVLR